jgi:hypothetical protein
MFTIEHGFEATTITLIDDAEAHLPEDVTINTFDDYVTLEQWDLRRDSLHKIKLFVNQAKGLVAALDLSEPYISAKKNEF